MNRIATPTSDQRSFATRLWLIVLTATVIGTGPIRAQIGTDYGLVAAGGTYTQLSGGTTLGSLAANDVISGNLAIGFTFVLDGASYTQARASSNGWLSLGTGATGSVPANGLTNTSPGRPFVAPLWDDLSGAGGFLGIGAGTAVYQTTGSAPNRVFTMEWRNWKWDRTMSGVTNTISFQCKLYETTNAIEFVYRQQTSSPVNSSGGASIGISGVPTGTGNFLSLNNTGASPVASGTSETTNLSGRPATGQVYRFLPCKAPVVITSVLTDCVAGTYQVAVQVTGLGSAPHVDITSSVSGTIANDQGIGTYSTPALSTSTAQTITVIHNGNTICNLNLGSFLGQICFPNGACQNPGPAIPDDGCGTNNVMEVGIPITGLPTALNSTVFFESVDLIVSHTYRGDLRISLISPTGQSRDLCLQRPSASAGGNNLGSTTACPATVLKLKDGGSALSTMNAGTTNAAVGTFAPEQTLAGFTGNPNGAWRLRICDAAGDDVGDLRHVKLNFLDCSPPVATATIVEDCANGVFRVNVNVTSTGSGGTVDLFSTILGLEQDNVGTGVYLLGPYPTGTPVSISVRHATSSSCDQPISNLTDCCAGVCSSARTAVVGDNITPPITCGNGASTGTGTRDARWFRWTAPYAGTITVSSCTQAPAVDTYVRLHSGACGGLTFLQQDDDGCGTFAAGSRIQNRPVAAGTTYYIEWDNRFSSNGFTWQLQYTITGSTDPCTALVIGCGQSFSANSTAGAPNTLPSTACAFNGAASTGGTHWWRYVAATSGEVYASLCGTTSFNSRLSVFDATASCSLPTCVAMNDDAAGCPSNSSEVRFASTAGQTYLIAVHGSGAAMGTYSLSLFCDVACAPAVNNDGCSAAITLTSHLADGTGASLTFDNSCAHVDAPTTVSGAAPAVGLWFTFNAGQNGRHRLHVRTNLQSPGYTASTMSYALYSGACDNMGATGELIAVGSAGGPNDLPVLTPGADYRLLIYNNGSLSQAGTFGVLIDHPGVNDAGVTAISQPTGLVCGTTVAPEITLKNFGEAVLTNAVIEVHLDGVLVLSHAWTGSLAYNASETLTLPVITTPQGLQDITVTAVSPNGAVDEIAANSAGTSSYDASGEIAKVVIRTDGAGAETTWSIYDVFFFPVANGGPYTGQNHVTVTTTVCLPTTFGNCYSLYLFDSAGDGLCCGDGEGYWEVRNAADDVLLRDRFVAATDGTQSPAVNPESPFYSMGHEFCLPSGPSNILTSECGLFNNTLLNKVYTSPVPGALMYQFEFSQPDEGSLRRIAVPRNWVKFGEMVTSPLMPGVRYFTRVRVDQGAAGFYDDRFGGGCEMGIDPVAVPGCTQLIDQPTLPTHSCGVTKSFGGSDKIWAQPVVGGTAYRFQFSNPGEGYNRIIQTPSYICVLNWVTQPLVNGQYQVTVSVLVNGQWSGYCGAACTVTILNVPEGLALQPRVAEVAVERIDLVMYPNPVTDGRVHVRIGGLLEGTHAVNVDIYDMGGRRIQAERYTLEGESIDQVLELTGGMGAGTYLVNVLIDGRTHARRLSVL